MTVRIRPAEKRDLPSLAEFALALAEAYVALDARCFAVPDGGGQAFLEFFGSELARAETALLIAEEDATPLGYAFVRMEPASIEALCRPSAWLRDLYVDHAFRGRGAGRQLVAAAIDAARRMGSPSLMLGVSPANTEARGLYESLGMRETMAEMRLDLANQPWQSAE